jgi:hypothetical protein
LPLAAQVGLASLLSKTFGSLRCKPLKSLAELTYQLLLILAARRCFFLCRYAPNTAKEPFSPINSFCARYIGLAAQVGLALPLFKQTINSDSRFSR